MIPPPLPDKLSPGLRALFGVGLTAVAPLFVIGLGMLTVVQIFSLPTTSMEPTLLSGDRLLSLRHVFMDRIRRGDLVVFSYPVDHRQIFVKRVVGMPGDRRRQPRYVARQPLLGLRS